MKVAFELARALAATERNDSFHIARLLLLMSAHAHGRDKNKSIDGLTKLAKLDFLLRYPNCLERALKASNRSIDEAKVKEFERTTIESKMIRFRYGPWDHRYRRWVSLMAAKGLIVVGVVGKTVHIWLTDEGHDIASILSSAESYKILAERAAIVEKRFGGRSGTGLKDFIYETFPELINMKWGEEIVL
jgi:hypothetical protein